MSDDPLEPPQYIDVLGRQYAIRRLEGRLYFNGEDVPSLVDCARAQIDVAAHPDDHPDDFLLRAVVCVCRAAKVEADTIAARRPSQPAPKRKTKAKPAAKRKPRRKWPEAP